jgi:hypothetical protein
VVEKRSVDELSVLIALVNSGGGAGTDEMSLLLLFSSLFSFDSLCLLISANLSSKYI